MIFSSDFRETPNQGIIVRIAIYCVYLVDYLLVIEVYQRPVIWQGRPYACSENGNKTLSASESYLGCLLRDASFCFKFIENK